MSDHSRDATYMLSPPLDVWFSKPQLSYIDGRWRCRAIRVDEWTVAGYGDSPEEAFNNMKESIIAVYKRIGDVEFV